MENQMQQQTQSDEQLGLQVALDTFRQQRNQAYDQIVDMQANLAVMDRKMRAAELRADTAKKLAQTFRTHAVLLHGLLVDHELDDEIPATVLKDIDLENKPQDRDTNIPNP